MSDYERIPLIHSTIKDSDGKPATGSAHPDQLAQLLEEGWTKAPEKKTPEKK